MRRKENGIKKRREERLRHLMAGNDSTAFEAEREDIYSPTSSSYWSEEPEMPPSTGGIRKNKWVLQSVLSLFLISFVYMVFHVNVPAAPQMKTFITETMERSFHFEAMSSWYKERFGEQPTLLPTLATKEKAPTTTRENQFITPVSGTLIAPFYRDGQGVWLGVTKQEQVNSIEEGWVVFAGEREGMGKTVVVRHSQGMESWYARLDNIQVKENEWVQSGDAIGIISPEGGQDGFVYFALKEGESFIDPAGVIAFE